MWGHLQWLHPVKSNQGNPTRNVVVVKNCAGLSHVAQRAVLSLQGNLKSLFWCTFCNGHFSQEVEESYALMFIIAIIAIDNK